MTSTPSSLRQYALPYCIPRMNNSPPGFTSSLVETPSTHYTQIQSASIVITAMTRTTARRWVPPEPYRQTLADDAQLFLFDEMCRRVREGARLYALVTYGGAHDDPVATLAEILFPTPSGHVAPGTIDLLTTFPKIVETYRPAPAAEPNVSLRRKRESGDAG